MFHATMKEDRIKLKMYLVAEVTYQERRDLLVGVP